MNNIKCRCCGSANVEKLADYNKFENLNCANCGFQSFTPRDAAIMPSLYEDDADYIDDLHVLTSPEDLILWHHIEAINFINSKFSEKNTKTLDIGCFNGFFVKKMHSLGYDAEGIDFNKNAVGYGKSEFNLGLRISTRTLNEVFLSGKKFDVITLFEVIEHLPNAQQFLQEVAKLLTDDGILILSTPNKNMCWRPALDFPPHHLSRFTMNSLKHCVSQIGLHPLYVAEQMSLFDLTRHYIGTFFRSNDDASLRGGEFKRKKLTRVLRQILNKIRGLVVTLLVPVDKLLYLIGLRYISQIVIAAKVK